MTATTKELEKKLRDLGLSRDAVKAAWPVWWSEEAETSPSALNDLKFSLARKLGISPPSLFDEGDAVFVWHGDAKFKGLTTESDAEQQALVSFGTSIANLLLTCYEAPEGRTLEGVSPLQLRNAVLEAGARAVNISHLLHISRSLGIPVVYLKVFPLEAKHMTAMTVRIGDRYAILLGRDAMYSAPVSFYIAHEMGHIAERHLGKEAVLVDIDLGEGCEHDKEETAADVFALQILTGREKISFDVNRPPRNATELAAAVREASNKERVDPGVLAMCYGYAEQKWSLANSALKLLYGKGKPAWKEVNRMAIRALDLEKLTSDHQDYVCSVLGIRDDERRSS